MLKVSPEIKKLAATKKSIAALLADIKDIASEFQGTTFELFIDRDPEDGEKTLMIGVVSSEIPKRKLDKQLSLALLAIYGKSVRAGLPLIHTFESAAHKQYA